MLDVLECVFLGVERWLLQNSWICQRLAEGATPFLKRAFPRPLFLRRDARTFRPFRGRQRIIRAWDQSWFFRGLEHLREAILNTSLSFFARLLFLCGVFCFCGGVIRGKSFPSVDILLPIVLFLSSFPILSSHESLRKAVSNSRWLASLWETFPSVGEITGESEDVGDTHPMVLFVTSVLVGGCSFFVSPWLLFILLAEVLLWVAVCSVPECLGLGVCFSIPFFNLTPHPTVLLLSVTGGLLLLWGWKMLRCRRTLRVTRMDLPVLLLGIVYFLSGAFTGREALLQGWTKALLLSLYFPWRSFFRRKQWIFKARFLIEISALICAFLGTFQYILGKAPLDWVDLDRFSGIGGRVTSCFSNPNFFAMYLLLTIPLSLANGLSKNVSARSRSVSWIAFVVQSAALLLTWSRGAWLGWIVAIGTLLVFFSPRTKALFVFLLPPIVAALSWAPATVRNRFSSIGSFGESSIRFRLYTWKGVWRMIKAHPLGVGVGESTFRAHYLPYAVSGTEGVTHTHQIFLQIWSELGIQGLFLLLIFLLLLVLLFFYKKGAPSSSLSVCRTGALCGIFGLFTMGWFDAVWYHNGIFCLFWILAAMAISAVPPRNEEENP